MLHYANEGDLSQFTDIFHLVRAIRNIAASGLNVLLTEVTSLMFCYLEGEIIRVRGEIRRWRGVKNVFVTTDNIG